MKLALLLWIASILPQPVAAQTCLATTVYLEARGQSLRGQMAVAEVALRRKDEGQWGNTLCDVVTAPHQFATGTTPKSYVLDNMKAWLASWKVAEKSIANWNLPKDKRKLVVPHANHFATLKISNKWTQKGPMYKIGNHAFYAVN